MSRLTNTWLSVATHNKNGVGPQTCQVSAQNVTLSVDILSVLHLVRSALARPPWRTVRSAYFLLPQYSRTGPLGGCTKARAWTTIMVDAGVVQATCAPRALVSVRATGVRQIVLCEIMPHPTATICTAR